MTCAGTITAYRAWRFRRTTLPVSCRKPATTNLGGVWYCPMHAAAVRATHHAIVASILSIPTRPPLDDPRPSPGLSAAAIGDGNAPDRAERATGSGVRGELPA